MPEEHAIIRNHETALCTVQNCQRPATHSYLWPWGDAGYCCSRCMVTLQHQAANLGREVTFVSLTEKAPSELESNERIQLNARVLAAEQEVAVVKERNRKLFEGNQTLTGEVRQLRAELEAFQGQLADARAECDQLTQEKMSALKQLSETNHELARLQGIFEAGGQTP